LNELLGSRFPLEGLIVPTNSAIEVALRPARLRTGRKTFIKVVYHLSNQSQEAAEITIRVPFNDLDRLSVSLSRDEVAL